jgi:hypothetical protein
MISQDFNEDALPGVSLLKTLPEVLEPPGGLIQQVWLFPLL